MVWNASEMLGMVLRVAWKKFGRALPARPPALPLPTFTYIWWELVTSGGIVVTSRLEKLSLTRQSGGMRRGPKSMNFRSFSSREKE